MAKKSARRRKIKRPAARERAARLALEPRNGVAVAVYGDDEGPAERRRHGPVEETDTLVDGRLARVRRSVDLIGALRGRGAITAEQAAAGRRFRADFDRARFDPRQAADPGRAPGGERSAGDLSDPVYDARDRLWRALRALGGHASPAGSAAWHVLGVGDGLGAWARTVLQHGAQELQRDPPRFGRLGFL